MTRLFQSCEMQIQNGGPCLSRPSVIGRPLPLEPEQDLFFETTSIGKNMFIALTFSLRLDVVVLPTTDQ